MSVVKLSVHKNNMHQRAKKQLRQHASLNTKKCVNMPEVAGYCTIAWCADGSANMAWQITGQSGIRIADVPAFLSHAITRQLNLIDKDKK